MVAMIKNSVRKMGYKFDSFIDDIGIKFDPFKYVWTPSVELINSIQMCKSIINEVNTNKYRRKWEQLKLLSYKIYVTNRMRLNRKKLKICCFFIFDVPEKIQNFRYRKYLKDYEDK